MSRVIAVVPYDPQWPSLFAQEAAALYKVLGDNCLEIHHIGSTAVPGLAAKPVIDMIPVVADITCVDACNEHMRALGYDPQGEFGMPFRRFFQKGTDNRTHHVHIFEQGSAEIERHLKFRDWMRTHTDDRQAYAQLKNDLASKFAHDNNAYCLGKEEFISQIDKKTGFSALRMVQARTQQEWNAVQHMRQLYFFEPASIKDAYCWTFSHPGHVHLVLYHGSEIIGYAHLVLWANQRAGMYIFVINKEKGNSQFGSHFLNQCERWLKNQGYYSLHVESRPSFLSFYKNNGYIEMPFGENDHGTASPDVALGKIL